MSPLPYSVSTGISRQNLIQSLENHAYGPDFKRLVFEQFDGDHAKGEEYDWNAVMLIPQLDSQEDDEIIPYQVCIIRYREDRMIGFCVNEPLRLAYPMPMLECIEVWAQLLIEQGKLNKAKEDSGV